MAEAVEHVETDAIIRRIGAVRERIASACRRAGRSPDDVTLIAVSKTFPVDAVEAARSAGLRHFGENLVQNLVDKVEALPSRQLGGDVAWYMIGHLQRNKARDVVHYADYFQALDSPRLAEELDKRARRAGRVMPCLVEVNVSGEESKYGIEPDETHEFLDQLAAYEHIKVDGLMTIASYVDDPEDVRAQFRRVRELFATYEPAPGSTVEMKELSMGMSNDFEVAVEEGATHVRIGSAIFGERDY